jgi:hypothetical protein
MKLSEAGSGGVLATVREITEKVVAERRAIALRDLGSGEAETRVEEYVVPALTAIARPHWRSNGPRKYATPAFPPYPLGYLTRP